MNESGQESRQDSTLLGTTAISGGSQMASMGHECISNTLSPKQRQYLIKLGLTTGRKIVPIDLGLYRELIKLNLIEDKGRRVALTKLGGEVFRQIN